MKIGKVAGVETRLLEMPYTKPLVTATNNFTVARGLLVKVVTDGGIEGYGYSDLFPRTGETPQTAQHVIDTVLRPKVVGRELEDLARVRAEIDHALTGNPRAKSSLETAMVDALARSYHMPLAVMLGGKYRSEIRVIKMVSVDTPEKMAEEAKSAGYIFPYLYDETQAVAKAYRAACTPDLFLFDKDQRLVYRGQFDDSRPGNNVPVTGQDLRAALAALRDHARIAFVQFRKAARAVPEACAPPFLTAAVVPPLLARLDASAADPFREIEMPQWRRQWALWRAAQRWPAV